MRCLRVLLVADTHLGFDLPLRPRIRRRRRGEDFQANWERALAPAAAGEVDVVVHGGDVFHRSRVPGPVAASGFAPLLRVADRGVPVFIVPGNHERGRLPHSRLARHARIHVFDRPRTFVVEAAGLRVGIAGFPSVRGDIRAGFRRVLEESAWASPPADIRLLCMHQCVEGATVGPSDFTFTTGRDVVRAADLPGGVAAVLSGHIQRHQVLARDLRGRTTPSVVLYPGSVERTSIAEKDEVKGYLTLDVQPGDGGGRLAAWTFHALPARPLLVHDIRLRDLRPTSLEAHLRALFEVSPPDAVLRLRVHGRPQPKQQELLSAPRLRRLAPPSMNVEVSFADAPRPRARRVGSSAPPSPALELPLG